MSFSTWLYDWMLALYPADLRSEFGPEMSEVFRDDLTDAWRCGGLTAVIGVWWCAVCEIPRVALPGQRGNPAFTVPAISFALSLLAQGGTVLAIRSQLSQEPPAALFFLLIVSIILPSVVTAVTALLVVHTGKVSVVSLDLCSKSAI